MVLKIEAEEKVTAAIKKLSRLRKLLKTAEEEKDNAHRAVQENNRNSKKASLQTADDEEAKELVRLLKIELGLTEKAIQYNNIIISRTLVIDNILGELSNRSSIKFKTHYEKTLSKSKTDINDAIIDLSAIEARIKHLHAQRLKLKKKKKHGAVAALVSKLV